MWPLSVPYWCVKVSSLGTDMSILLVRAGMGLQYGQPLVLAESYGSEPLYMLIHDTSVLVLFRRFYHLQWRPQPLCLSNHNLLYVTIYYWLIFFAVIRSGSSFSRFQVLAVSTTSYFDINFELVGLLFGFRRRLKNWFKRYYYQLTNENHIHVPLIGN